MITIGDICAFRFTDGAWKIGKVLQFCYINENKERERQYKGTSYDCRCEVKQTEVMCTWFTSSTNPKIFEFNISTIDHTMPETHSFISVKSYLCTLSRVCFESLDCRDVTFSKLLSTDSDRIALMTAHNVTLTTAAINTLCVSDEQSQNTSIIHVSRDLDKMQDQGVLWVKNGTLTLMKQDKDRLMGGHELTDNDINFAQLLLKSQFPDIDGFRNTLEQNKPFRKVSKCSKIMQVIFIRKCHWACILLNENRVFLYDSAYTAVSTDTFQVISRLVQCTDSSFNIEVMNIPKQSGAVDCGLYAHCSAYESST